jgi:hypothetical protein
MKLVQARGVRFDPRTAPRDALAHRRKQPASPLRSKTIRLGTWLQFRHLRHCLPRTPLVDPDFVVCVQLSRANQFAEVLHGDRSKLFAQHFVVAGVGHRSARRGSSESGFVRNGKSGNPQYRRSPQDSSGRYDLKSRAVRRISTPPNSHCILTGSQVACVIATERRESPPGSPICSIHENRADRVAVVLRWQPPGRAESIETASKARPPAKPPPCLRGYIAQHHNSPIPIEFDRRTKDHPSCIARPSRHFSDLPPSLCLW